MLVSGFGSLLSWKFRFYTGKSGAACNFKGPLKVLLCVEFVITTYIP